MLGNSLRSDFGRTALVAGLIDGDDVVAAGDGLWHDARKDGDDVVIVPSIQDPEVIKQKFPKGYKAVKPYLRITPQPNK